jgi:hypothetical protein
MIHAHTERRRRFHPVPKRSKVVLLKKSGESTTKRSICILALWRHGHSPNHFHCWRLLAGPRPAAAAANGATGGRTSEEPPCGAGTEAESAAAAADDLQPLPPTQNRTGGCGINTMAPYFTTGYPFQGKTRIHVILTLRLYRGTKFAKMLQICVILFWFIFFKIKRSLIANLYYFQEIYLLIWSSTM